MFMGAREILHLANNVAIYSHNVVGELLLFSIARQGDPYRHVRMEQHSR